MQRLRRVQRADERDLQEQVDERADDQRQDHRPGDVLLRVLRLAADLDAHLEPGLREDDAERERREDPVEPVRANPPPAVKLEAWNLVVISATTVSIGMKTFQITATALVSDSHFTPIALITTNTSRNPAPAKMPRPVSRPLELMKCRRRACSARSR